MISRCTVLFLLACSLCLTARGQDVDYEPLLAPGYYIVVAAYRGPQLGFAKRFAARISTQGRKAQYGYDAGRKFYYVYLDYYTNFDESIRVMLNTRQTGGFTDAWVRIMKLQVANAKVNLLVENNPVELKKEEDAPPKEEVAAKVQEPIKPQEPVKEEVVTTMTSPPIQPVDNPSADPVYRPQILQNTPVFISLYNPTNNTIVQGDLEVVDTERSKLITKVKGNEYLSLPDPKSTTGMLTLITTSFGYRKMQHEINYKSTEKDTLQEFVVLMGSYYMIKFDMVRLHRGDIATLYNVYFYNDAAVMLPESKYELNNLLQMMQSNPNYRVRLHGHTNGRATGKLITMGDQKNFFELTSDVKRGVGTAKDLSRERAEVIRDWLIANGITADRMEVRAWGGTRMLHDKNSPNARKNVRVEVEVLQD